MNTITDFFESTWIAFTVVASLAIIWTAAVMCVGAWVERYRVRRLKARQAEALRQLSRLSRELGEEL